MSLNSLVTDRSQLDSSIVFELLSMYVNTLIKVQHTSSSLISIFWFFDLPLKTPEINSLKVAFNFTNKLAEFSDWQGKISALSGLHVNAP